MNNPKGKRSMKILLATDGSACSKVAIDEVARRPFPVNTKVRLVCPYEKIPLTTIMDPVMSVAGEYYSEADDYALKNAKNIIENAATILHKKNPALIITTAVIEGSPKRVILNEAEKFGAELIVVGSHGYGVAERFLLGSVSHAVSLHAKCSVEIVRK